LGVRRGGKWKAEERATYPKGRGAIGKEEECTNYKCLRGNRNNRGTGGGLEKKKETEGSPGQQEKRRLKKKSKQTSVRGKMSRKRRRTKKEPRRKKGEKKSDKKGRPLKRSRHECTAKNPLRDGLKGNGEGGRGTPKETAQQALVGTPGKRGGTWKKHATKKGRDTRICGLGTSHKNTSWKKKKRSKVHSRVQRQGERRILVKPEHIKVAGKGTKENITI